MNKQNAQNEAIEMLLRKPIVIERTGLANSTLYYLIARGDFPIPVKLGVRSVAWRKTEIDDWINSRERSIIQGGESHDTK